MGGKGTNTTADYEVNLLHTETRKPEEEQRGLYHVTRLSGTGYRGRDPVVSPVG